MPQPREASPAPASDPYELRADRGLANYDLRNVGTLNATYTLPFRQGKRFAKGLSGIGNALAGGWTVNSIETLQSGLPVHPTTQLQPFE
jgi:hypothetical protein